MADPEKMTAQKLFERADEAYDRAMREVTHTKDGAPLKMTPELTEWAKKTASMVAEPWREKARARIAKDAEAAKPSVVKA